MREISAGIIIFRKTKEGPKFLLLYHGGRYWNFPKGKLEKEEDSYTAALREIKEETGLRPGDLTFSKKFKVYDRYIFTQQKRKIFKIVVYFLAETKNPIIRISFEHQGFGWFSHREALRMLIYQNQKNILNKAFKVLFS
ncbi:diadenosine tetraphosphate hydrolase [Candidatus Jorgensenbacteria bacterium CG_4_10_14_0_8_um_filter_39_13]|uniref:Bis(5'-nucleosyl)-tetraphosphatase [asymmetrical] n=2 Tax=Candidatus Joergenseniibacteriota TaxID=1752739 RepID=A0A2M7RGG2_9BACT|nr:MAG: diadenosine tetraphosphate hydrolase [Candidatus Jorgensenbacteria bacterium CG11_big_fil_rev_8_21_14_0_20_38_23]PIV13012.1 MAG: diadenosine tetraphosphate hydrolase [Candidatus Jorgensenbacteria bacterium CG03_land_8_20_14_0_80_38_39]PIW97542.1 MAG: diadenosine tetraphosphate hydrolase [Candidatus Jorgensenbacteria bacterium CG_4_8_14_3_um_filter_38_10]PIY95839.1 MAG: diadenosine tetraphosphate hydrolase [Candidatus Jorgensenbacteria bacterium CG_4_10_14_0_8_um_filter_39_13]PJA95035.1 